MFKQIWSMKKCILLLVLVLLLTSCTKAKSDNKTVSKEAKKIIDVMMTCPNLELFAPSNVTMIGEGVEISEGEQEKTAKRSREIYENWEKEIGSYFEEGKLEKFYGEGATMYLAEAAQENIEINVEEVSLQEKSELTEKVQVTLLKGKQKEEVVLVFKYDSEGLISDVEIEF